MRKTTRGNSPHPLLSAREYEVITLYAQGKMVKEIADILLISTSSVETSLERAKNKIGVRTGRLLVHYAIDQGMIQVIPSPPPPARPTEEP